VLFAVFRPLFGQVSGEELSFIIVTFLHRGSNFLVAIEVLRHFNAFHKLCYFSNSFGWGVKTLRIHFALSALGCVPEKNVDDFVIG